MNNHTFVGTFRGLFGKAFVAAIFSMFPAIAANAQTNNIYYIDGNSYYGQVRVFPRSQFEIYTNGTIIKTLRNNCTNVSGNGVRCAFGQWRDGRHIYSGDALFYRNGYVYLRWTNENMGAYRRSIDGSWIGFYPR